MKGEGRAVGGGADAVDAPREGGERHRVDRRPAPVDRRVGDLLACETLDDIANVHPAADVTGRDSRWSGQPVATHARSIAACFPEQFIRTRVGSPCSRTRSSRVARITRPGRRARQVVLGQPPSVRMSRTTEACRSVPTWLAVEIASCSPSSTAPAVMQATACRGLRLERGRINASGVAVAGDDVTIEESTIAAPALTRFDESTPFDDGEFHGILNGESLQHPSTLAPGTPSLTSGRRPLAD